MMEEVKSTKAFYNTQIPSDWKIKKLGTLVEIVSGVSPSLFNLDVVGKYPYLKVEDLNNCEKYQASSREFSNDEKQLVPKNSVIFPKRGAAILNNKVRINSVIVQMDSNLMAIYPKSEDLSFEYLYYQITFEQLHKIADTSTIPQINNKHIIPYSFPLPPLPEQKAIAQVLSTADAAIHTTEKLIAQKELRKKWLMQQLLTGKKRLKGFGGEWKSEILGNVVNLQHGYQFRDEDFVEEGIPVIKIRNVIGYDLVLTDMTFVDPNRLEEFKSVVIVNGDLLMSLTGNIGRVVEVKGIDRSLFQNYRVGKFTPIDKQITKAFLKFILSSDILFRQFNGLANQSAQANFGKQDMDKLKFRFPLALEEQTAIAQVLQAADKEISLLKAKLEKLREQKKGLMQLLLTGKKRIKL